MSGHSKWAGIKHKKAIVDARRGQVFTKVTRELTVAAREGGPDIEGNFRLRLAMQKAREVNMPADNIERAIQRGAGGKDGVQLEEVRYEGYGPHGVAVMVDTLTDNRDPEELALELLDAVDVGEDGDISVDGDEVVVTVAPSRFEEVRRTLEERNYSVDSAEVTMNPTTSVPLDAPQARQVLRLLDGLEEHDDVQQVYANAEIPDDVLDAVS